MSQSRFGLWNPQARCTWLVVLVLALQGCILPSRPAWSGARFNRGTNATWLGVEWISKPQQVTDITALADKLARLQIHYVFVFATYLRADGEFGATYKQASEFIRVVKAVQPTISLQAWVGVPVSQAWLPARKGSGADLADSATRHKVAALCRELVQDYGFDGIHLDAEPIAGGDVHLLSLLGEVRQAIGPQAMLSVATRRICPKVLGRTTSLSHWFAWDASYYREVAKRVDQIAVMIYDSALPLSELYRWWGRVQVIEISEAVRGTGVGVLYGVPTSEERTWTHWPSAENMVSGLQGIIDGLSAPNAEPSVVVGIAVYPYWETSETEWAQYRTLWLGEYELESR